MFDWKKIALFVGGTLFGTAGIKILSSKDAKNAYTQATAAVLRGKDCVMKTVTTVQENTEDILADAKSVNEQRAAQAESCEFQDTKTESEETVTEEAVTE